MAADPVPDPTPRSAPGSVPDAFAETFAGPAPRRFIDLPGFPRIAWAEAGSGPPLILIHGALVTLDDLWLGPMAALAFIKLRRLAGAT